MPGQYKHLCKAFAANPDNTVVFLTKPKKDVEVQGVHKVEFMPPREPSPHTHPYIIGFERAIIEGQEVWRMCKKLRDEEGFIPDVICAHPGWGDAMFVKDIYPQTPLLSFFEFYYRSHGADVNFDPNDQATPDDCARIRVKNANNILALEAADWGLSPTYWQYVQNPVEFRSKISVIHDGVDTDIAVPDENASITINNLTLTKKDEVITYVSRNFEPYRGFPTFMKAAKMILDSRPNTHIIAVGADDVSYGKRPPEGTTYRRIYMRECGLENHPRLHWVGYLDYERFLKILRISSAHIYLTYPFVLSWSMMEAMSSECLVIGSNTPPVEEVITDGVNGLITDFFNPEMLASRIDEVFAHKDRMLDIKKRARKTVLDRYALSKLLPLHMDLVRDVAKGIYPPQAALKIQKMNEEFGIIPKPDDQKPKQMALL